MAFDKIKKHFYSYINAKDFMTVFGALASSALLYGLQCAYSYLEEKEAVEISRRENLDNQMKINFISYKDYEFFIDKKNLKPIPVEDIEKEIEELENKTFKQKFLETVNGWIKGNKDNKKSKKNGSNVDTNKLIEMQEEHLKKQKEEAEKKAEAERLKKMEESSKNNVPPVKNKVKVVETQYFVVNYGDGAYIDPNKYRIENQNSQGKIEPQKKQVVGTIAHQTIRKQTVWESIKDGFIILFGKSDNKGRYQNGERGVVIDSRYDQYGRRIKQHNRSISIEINKKKKCRKNDKKCLAKQQQEELEKQRELEEQERQRKLKEEPIVSKFILDGNMQKTKEYDKIENADILKQLTVKDMRTLTLIEYKLEECWNEYISKYEDSGVFITVELTFDNDAKPQNLTVLDYSRDKGTKEEIKAMYEDITDLAKKCRFSKVQGLTEDNYNIWQKMQITFRSES